MVWYNPLPPWPHSQEIEHRLTVTEIKIEDHDRRISLLEKAILGIYGALVILAQDKLPLIAKALKNSLP